MKVKKESFFWTSYSDLMTSLFFIMMVLFVLVIVMQHKSLQITQDKLTKIEEVVNSTKDLDEEYFEYKKEYKKYQLKVKVLYPSGSSKIETLDTVSVEKLRKAGEEICSFLSSDKHKKFQYLLIIEGQASADGWGYNYQLSYERALALIRYWTQTCNISFGENCEIQIAGSGDGTIPTRAQREEGADITVNQRFLIHLLPKNIIEDSE